MEQRQISVTVTEEEEEALAALAESKGKTLSQIVREAVDGVLERSDEQRRLAALERAAGMWKDRTDLPDFEALRKEADRRLERD